MWEQLDHLGSLNLPFAEPDRPRPYPTDELIESVGLTEHRNKKVSTLSGGQRRRLDVAIGIVGRPELLFLDELARAAAGTAEVRWTQDGTRQVHPTVDPPAFVRELFAPEGEVTSIFDLEVQRPSLESTHLSMVAQQDATFQELPAELPAEFPQEEAR